jgi:hypothetical protein
MPGEQPSGKSSFGTALPTWRLWRISAWRKTLAVIGVLVLVLLCWRLMLPNKMPPASRTNNAMVAEPFATLPDSNPRAPSTGARNSLTTQQGVDVLCGFGMISEQRDLQKSLSAISSQEGVSEATLATISHQIHAFIDHANSAMDEDIKAAEPYRCDAELMIRFRKYVSTMTGEAGIFDSHPVIPAGSDVANLDDTLKARFNAWLLMEGVAHEVTESAWTPVMQRLEELKESIQQK